MYRSLHGGHLLKKEYLSFIQEKQNIYILIIDERNISYYTFLPKEQFEHSSRQVNLICTGSDEIAIFLNILTCIFSTAIRIYTRYSLSFCLYREIVRIPYKNVYLVQKTGFSQNHDVYSEILSIYAYSLHFFPLQYFPSQ